LKNLLVATDIASPNVLKIKDSDNLDFVMKQFSITGLDELPVISSNGTEEVIGTIWQRDVITAYNHQIFLRDMSGETSHSIRQLARQKTVHVIDRYHLKEEEVPTLFVDKTLGSIDMRKNYKIEVLLIKRQSYNGKETKIEYIQPNAQTVLQLNDILLIFGSKSDIDRLARV